MCSYNNKLKYGGHLLIYSGTYDFEVFQSILLIDLHGKGPTKDKAHLSILITHACKYITCDFYHGKTQILF